MDYGFASFVNAVTIIVGFITMLVGGVLFIYFLQNGLLQAFTVGGLIIATGMVIVAVAQLSNATIETAKESRKTNDLLAKLILSNTDTPRLNSNFSSTSDTNRSSSDTAVVNRNEGNVVYVKTYKGYRIEKIEGTRFFLVDGKEFEGILAAEKYINGQLES
jgi:hypothetical protein